MSKPIRILHVFGRMVHGGAETRTLDLLRYVDRRRYRFDFCALSGRPGPLDEQIRALGGRVHLLRLRMIGFAGRFRRLLSRHQYDAVHSHVHYPSGFLLRLAAGGGTPIRVCHFRNTHDGRGRGAGRRLLRRVLRRWIDRYSTDILAVSEAAMSGSWGPHWRSDPRCRVIYNGLEPSAFEVRADRRGVRRQFGFLEDAPLYIHVGRFARQKNHPRLLSIFAQVSRRQPTAGLLLVGGGDRQGERHVRRRIVELGLEGRVALGGVRNDVPRLLKAADAMIFPSLWEGLPGVVLEACAAGTPVLASDLPGIREIAARLAHVRCLSLDAEDRAWARAAVQIAAEAESDAGRRTAYRSFAASEFTVDRCAEATCRVWQPSGAKLRRGGVLCG